MQDLMKKLKQIIEDGMARYITGSRTPTPDEVLKIADAVGQYERLTRLSCQQYPSDEAGEKRTAVPTGQTQGRQKEIKSYVTVDFLVDVIASMTEITPRYKRRLKTDNDALRQFLKIQLGLNLNYIKTDENINDGLDA